ncbi:unnamed protein product [Camellia sinensis]
MAYPSIYAAVFINRFGPTDEDTANCLFGFDFSDLSNSNGRVRTIVICVVVIGCGFVLFLGCGGFWILRRKREKIRKRSKVDHERETNLAFGMNSINESTTLVMYTFEETFLKIYERVRERERDGNGVSSHKMKAKETIHHFLKKYTVPDIDGLRTLEGIIDILMFGFDDISFFCEINKRKSTEGGILTLSGKAGEVIVIIQTTGEVPVFVSNLRGEKEEEDSRRKKKTGEEGGGGGGGGGGGRRTGGGLKNGAGGGGGGGGGGRRRGRGMAIGDGGGGGAIGGGGESSFCIAVGWLTTVLGFPNKEKPLRTVPKPNHHYRRSKVTILNTSVAPESCLLVLVNKTKDAFRIEVHTQGSNAQEEDLDDSRREKRKSGNRKEKDSRKKKSSQYGSSDEDDLERITKGSRKKKKWYSSDENSTYSTESESEDDFDRDEKRNRNKKREKKRQGNSSKDEARGKLKKSRSKRNDYSSEDYSSVNSDGEDKEGYSHRKGSKSRGQKRVNKKGGEMESVGEDLSDYGRGSLDKNNIVRKEMGLEWMLRPKDNIERETATATTSDQLEEPQVEEVKENPRELNPYFKNNGTGYPEEADGTKAGQNQLLSSAVVGDGGASWRLKALKRAQEQAAREGMALEEVVGERWGSLGQLAVSVASRTAAPSRAHLHAIKNRKKGLSEEQQTTVDNQNEKVTEKNIGRERLRDTSRRHSEMKVPKLHDSLSWGKRKSQIMSSNKDSDLISTAMASLNKFANDGNFMSEVIRQQNDDRGGSPYNCERNVESELVSLESQKPGESSAVVNQGMSANQLAAKALQLRLKGKHEEAEKLLKEVENIKAKQSAVDESSEAQNERNRRRYGTHDTSIWQRKKEDDADMHLAQKIAQNKQYSISGRADDEYDFEDGPRRKTRKKGAKDNKLTEKTNFPQRILTQQERCQFCFENPSRPRHLVVAIANFTYLSLPHWQSIVPGHCCILTSQHESATRAVDNNVWDEIRNFKKCLIMMFAKQEKDVVFLETVMGLAQQRRHCMVECIPLPQDIAKQAPLYFKKAIDEAEDEWSQHNSKKLIDTSEKGLRGSIPKDFPYFHVEFGLNKGFVHVMDDEKQFKSNFGLNVIRGMLRLPEEDMYGRRKHDSVETQKQAVVSFVKDWEPFDWTKQLD